MIYQGNAGPIALQRTHSFKTSMFSFLVANPPALQWIRKNGCKVTSSAAITSLPGLEETTFPLMSLQHKQEQTSWVPKHPHCLTLASMRRSSYVLMSMDSGLAHWRSWLINSWHSSWLFTTGNRFSRAGRGGHAFWGMIGTAGVMLYLEYLGCNAWGDPTGAREFHVLWWWCKSAQ